MGTRVFLAKNKKRDPRSLYQRLFLSLPLFSRTMQRVKEAAWCAVIGGHTFSQVRVSCAPLCARVFFSPFNDPAHFGGGGQGSAAKLSRHSCR